MINKFINKIHQGNSLDILRQMPDSSVDNVITSPPYWMLRDYGYDDQWGLEPTYQEYLEHLWLLMDETYRILKPTGTVWINLGDTYGTTSGNLVQGNIGTNKIKYTGKIHGYNKPAAAHKCLLLIPHRFAIGCIDRGWIVRNDIIWAKRNGMPESCRDRFSKKHEYFFLMVKQQKYYFDLDGIRDKRTALENRPDGVIRERIYGYNSKRKKFGAWNDHGPDDIIRGNRINNKYNNSKGKNPGDVSDFWDIPTRPSSKAHYASYNFKLIEKPIIAGCPEFVCKKCGKPREKILNRTNKTTTQIAKEKGNTDFRSKGGKKVLQNLDYKGGHGTNLAEYQITGLTDCGCGEGFEGGIVLDPFCGVGTTLVRALQLDRNIIGIDGSKEYCDIARKYISKEINQLKIFA